jgi:hypothetical protein
MRTQFVCLSAQLPNLQAPEQRTEQHFSKFLNLQDR